MSTENNEEQIIGTGQELGQQNTIEQQNEENIEPNEQHEQNELLLDDDVANSTETPTLGNFQALQHMFNQFNNQTLTLHYVRRNKKSYS